VIESLARSMKGSLLGNSFLGNSFLGKVLRSPTTLRRRGSFLLHQAITAFNPYCKPSGEMPLLINGKPCIWLAWPGDDEMPGYLQACLDTVKRHNSEHFEVVVITPRNVGQYLDGIHPAFELLSYVHRADYIRCEILNQRGGIYLDTDTLAFRSFKVFYDLLELYDIVNYDGSKWQEVFGLSAFGPTRRGSLLTSAWSQKLHQRLDERHEDLARFRSTCADLREDCLAWTEILRNIVVPVAKGLQRRRQLSYYKVSLDHFQVASEMFSLEQILSGQDARVSSDAYLLVLNNALYPKEVRQLTKEQALESSSGIGQLLRQANA